jgi:hypothetical protein
MDGMSRQTRHSLTRANAKARTTAGWRTVDTRPLVHRGYVKGTPNWTCKCQSLWRRDLYAGGVGTVGRYGVVSLDLAARAPTGGELRS